MKKVLIFGLFLVCLSSCDETGKKKALKDRIESESAGMDTKVADESIGEIFENIPSPLEISVMLKESGTNYNMSYLNNPENAQNYDTDFKRAINLGIYGTDLGYINIYEQNQDAIDYVKVIRSNADGLNIGQFFDFQTIQQLASERSNLDSLLLVTTQNFNKINTHLQDQKRADLSVLILAGGWLEALHLTIKVFEQKPNAAIREKIGEQKIVLSQLMLLINQFKGNPKIAELQKAFKPLKEIYDKVNIKREVKEPEIKEIDGVVYIQDRSETIVEMTDSDLANIQNYVEDIRSKVVE